MTCPKCGGRCEPWPWYDGGYKGIQCSTCGMGYWSESFSDAAYEVDEEARRKVAALADELPFPADAEDNDSWRKRMRS